MHVLSPGRTAKLNFYAFDTPPSHTRKNSIMIAVGQAGVSWPRCKFELGRHIGTGLEDLEWVEKFVFWLPVWCISTWCGIGHGCFLDSLRGSNCDFNSIG